MSRGFGNDNARNCHRRPTHVVCAVPQLFSSQVTFIPSLLMKRPESHRRPVLAVALLTCTSLSSCCNAFVSSALTSGGWTGTEFALLRGISPVVWLPSRQLGNSARLNVTSSSHHTHQMCT